MMEEKNINTIVEFLESKVKLDKIELPEEYFYSCLPLCLLDAIYSIGVRYESTRNVVKKYKEKYNLISTRDENVMHKIDGQHTLTTLIDNIDEYGFESFAKEVVENEQLTSSRNGMLKIQAVYECAQILSNYGIETIKDFNEKINGEIETKYKTVKGQTSGISFDYLKMLCGEVNMIKQDRHILRFLDKFYEKEVKTEEAKNIIKILVEELNKKNHNINMRELDYVIWKYMSKESGCDKKEAKDE